MQPIYLHMHTVCVVICHLLKCVHSTEELDFRFGPWFCFGASEESLHLSKLHSLIPVQGLRGFKRTPAIVVEDIE